MARLLQTVAFASAAAAITINTTTAPLSPWGGSAQDPSFGKFINDGGAGGKVGGINLLSLSDANQGFAVHTAMAYMSDSDPNNITVIGNYKSTPPQLFGGSGAGMVNAIPNVDPLQGSDFAPAPHVAFLQVPNTANNGLTIWPVHNYSSGEYQYNTLVEITAVDAQTLIDAGENVPANRTQPILFNVL